jgi:hypothetical protein
VGDTEFLYDGLTPIQELNGVTAYRYCYSSDDIVRPEKTLLNLLDGYNYSLRTPERLPKGQRDIAALGPGGRRLEGPPCRECGLDAIGRGVSKPLPGPERGTRRDLVIPPAGIGWARKK